MKCIIPNYGLPEYIWRHSLLSHDYISLTSSRPLASASACCRPMPERIENSRLARRHIRRQSLDKVRMWCQHRDKHSRWWACQGQGTGTWFVRSSQLYIDGSSTCPCATRRISIYKGLATFHIRCSRNCQWDERRSLGVGVKALASNPLKAAAVGNVAVVSVAERYVLLSWTQVNHSMRCR